MLQKISLGLLACMIAGVLPSSKALAAGRDPVKAKATIIANTWIYSDAKKSAVIGKYPQPVTAMAEGPFPGNWYRIPLSGATEYGWVEAESLIFQTPLASASTSSSPRGFVPVLPSRVLSVSAGLRTASPSALLITGTEPAESGTMMGFGLLATSKLSHDWRIGIGLDRFIFNRKTSALATPSVYEITELAALFHLYWRIPLHLKRFAFEVNAALGGVMTSVQTPWLLTSGILAPTFQGGLLTSMKLTESFWATAGAGYRVLSLSDIPVSQLAESTATGNANINLSGVSLTLGLSYAFQ
ncbi:MAG TPA: hypothetical protein DCS07_09445 [Bdellovibrionales bacterium]|nr:MAG: hypothetical protein A2Z97_05315 [Bdellovibrionales bacterium GWB1_52_6]OFZ05693.1 MAG: hypothetical protein A2X97_03225 [Bdellovibrionales bacterium GWA1_52_35]OFZ40644.1 MAG: hypothetical protein A2070_06235 [Bdellovibrionales bacterium GWC1_52_8]HAR42835.1 hypothetical protein [Bdellovibrionales bacterium]HCM40373.1 hypothetical protein [Bdellovibrionales bacterium]